MIKVTPGNILLQIIKAEQKTASGIILPQEKKDLPQTGKIIDGYKDLGIKKFTVVYFKMWAGEPIKYEGKDYLIVGHKDILGYEE